MSPRTWPPRRPRRAHILPTVQLNDSRALNALTQILIRRTNNNATYMVISRSLSGRGRQSVIGLVVNHRPDDDAHCPKGHFQNGELREKFGGTPSLVLYPGYKSFRNDSTT